MVDRRQFTWSEIQDSTQFVDFTGLPYLHLSGRHGIQQADAADKMQSDAFIFPCLVQTLLEYFSQFTVLNMRILMSRAQESLHKNSIL
ncbi:unnamed protein product [Protopolystoma xenopodis]|uniref:Uncharacterized protein n=1 Tax=Protopolystoma xenopodis TaxID=117903 RepID=A0A448XNE7_9PLAT|nr:unnamed protein product [Protopolystoma xenopodis]